MSDLGKIPLVVEYGDLLKIIETAVIRYYEEHPDLTDAQVERVYEVLIRTYKAGARAAEEPPVRMAALEEELYRRVAAVCEWCQGSVDAPWPKAKRQPALRTSDEIVACLKHLRRSVKFWTKESGRQGYLNYIKPYLP
jgi:hypothetical protein